MSEPAERQARALNPKGDSTALNQKHIMGLAVL